MSVDPDRKEQALITEALEQRGQTLSRAELRAEIVVSGGFVLASILIAVVFPPAAGLWRPEAAATCVVALVVALRAEFHSGAGWTVPSQLAYVPLLVTVPPALAPVVVVAALVVAKLPDVLRGRLRAVRLLRLPGNAWFAMGPAVVLCAAAPTAPEHLRAALIGIALLAQIGFDFGASALNEWMVRGASLREQLADTWVYAVDVALTPVGLLVAASVADRPWSALALVPLLGVLGIFGSERRRRVEGLVELNNAYQGTAQLLGDVVESDDSYTGEHSRDVVALAVATGRHLGLDAQSLHNLQFAALLHDVGKVAIPNEIINKPAKLDEREWEVMKTHTIEGQRMLDRIGGFMSTVGVIVRSHHERWDGRGYPDGLAGDEIPIEARIITCCDAWSAMTTNRSYRDALPAEAAEAELRRCAGTQFDPRVVEAVLMLEGLVRHAPAPADDRGGLTPALAA